MTFAVDWSLTLFSSIHLSCFRTDKGGAGDAEGKIPGTREEKAPLVARGGDGGVGGGGGDADPEPAAESVANNDRYSVPPRCRTSLLSKVLSSRGRKTGRHVFTLTEKYM